MKNVFLIIIGMALVTYVPRLLPFTLLKNKTPSKYLGRFLKLIPYTALGALILPGILNATPVLPMAGLVGGAVAFIICYVRGGIILPIFAAIAATYTILVF